MTRGEWESILGLSFERQLEILKSVEDFGDFMKGASEVAHHRQLSSLSGPLDEWFVIAQDIDPDTGRTFNEGLRIGFMGGRVEFSHHQSVQAKDSRVVSEFKNMIVKHNIWGKAQKPAWELHTKTADQRGGERMAIEPTEDDELFLRGRTLKALISRAEKKKTLAARKVGFRTAQIVQAHPKYL